MTGPSVKLASGSFPAALQLLGSAGSSGLLTITSDGRTAEIALHRGQVVCANSDQAGRLGNALLEKGWLTAETLEAVLRHQRRKKVHQPLGTILFELGMVPKEAAAVEIEEQIIRVMREVCGWDAAEYSFNPVEEELEGKVMPGTTQVTSLLLNVTGETTNP